MTKIDFVGKRNYWFILSSLVILAGLVGLFVQGLVFGVEFKGGTVTEAKFKKPAVISEVRQQLNKHQLGDSSIQTAGRKNKSVIIKSRQLTSKEEAGVKADLKKIGAVDFSIQSVGPSWGKQLTRGTVIALVLSVVIVLAFVAVRFDLKMGTAAIIALLHDVIIAIGIYALVGREVTTSAIAAFLTILGYSLYDTIVVFDRVRENSSYLKKQTYSDMVNLSVNQTLRRSINTSLTSIIPVTTLLIFGGETLQDFAFALLIGLVSGAYSSLFIASPILAIWKETEPKYRNLRQRLAKAKAS